MQLLNAAVPLRSALFVALVLWIAGCSCQVDTIPHASCSFALSLSSASDADWVTVTGGSSGHGNGTVTHRVAANTTSSARTASIKVVDTDGSASQGEQAHLWEAVR